MQLRASRRSLGHEEEVLGRVVEGDREKESMLGPFVWPHRVDRIPWEQDSPLWELMVLAQQVTSLGQWGHPGSLEWLQWGVPWPIDHHSPVWQAASVMAPVTQPVTPPLAIHALV